ncbi:MAG: hypothetical protein COB16_14580 [Rhodobacteraceae bacterium]|nr:MAG: hypothetical protein COB16_14580 [Paracoccaceae bacterium]
MAAVDQPFACTCGALRGHVSAHGVKIGTRAVCFCADCRAAVLYLGQPDPAPGPVDIFQTSPDSIEITQGSEHLQVMRLSPKGLLRWYAGCCNTPLANTLARPTLPFAGLHSNRFTNKDALGKIRARGFVPQPGKPPKTTGAAAMVLGIFKRMATSRMSGHWKQTPFFDIDSRQPVTKPTILSKEQRAKLS